MLRTLLIRLLLIFLGLVFALIVLELLLRFVTIPNRFALNRQQLAQWEADDELLLHLKPNLNLRITAHPEFSYTIHTNSQGLRDKEFSGAYDVAALGDSFTFGFGVENDEAWPQQLAAISDKRVANLGWAGWNSYVYPRTIERYAIPLDAKVWVWAFFINDLHESVGAETFLTSGSGNYLAEYEAQSAAPPLLNFRLMEIFATFMNPDLKLLPGSGDVVFENADFQMRLSHYAWDSSDPQNPDTSRGWELTEAALIEAQQMALANDATLVVMFIPAREHVYWPIVGDQLPDVEVQQLNTVADRLATFAASQDMPFLNLMAGFRERAEQGEMLYFPADGHWNPEGHQLAAQLLDDYLREMDLLD